MAAKKIICDTDVIIDYWKTANPRHLKTKEVITKIICQENYTYFNMKYI